MREQVCGQGLAPLSSTITSERKLSRRSTKAALTIAAHRIRIRHSIAAPHSTMQASYKRLNHRGPNLQHLLEHVLALQRGSTQESACVLECGATAAWRMRSQY